MFIKRASGKLHSGKPTAVGSDGVVKLGVLFSFEFVTIGKEFTLVRQKNKCLRVNYVPKTISLMYEEYYAFVELQKMN